MCWEMGKIYVQEQRWNEHVLVRKGQAIMGALSIHLHYTGIPSLHLPCARSSTTLSMVLTPSALKKGMTRSSN